MGKKDRGMICVEYLGKDYMIGEGETVSMLASNEERTVLCTIEGLGGSMIRLHPGNTFWERKHDDA